MPRIIVARANGEPSINWAVTRSSSDRSIARCANRSASTMSPTCALAYVALDSNVAVSIGIPIASSSAVNSEASDVASSLRLCPDSAITIPAMPVASDT